MSSAFHTPDTCYSGRGTPQKFVYSTATQSFQKRGEATDEEVRFIRTARGAFVHEDDLKNLDQNNRQLLRVGGLGGWESLSSPPSSSFLASDFADRVIQPGRRLDHTVQELDGTVLVGFHCECAEKPNIYCPLGAASCRQTKIREIGSSRIKDYEYSCEGYYNMFSRYAIPLCMFMMGFCLMLLFVSPKGKYARGYIRRLLRCQSEARYEESLRLELTRMMERAQRRRRRLAAYRAANPHRVYMTDINPTTATLSQLAGFTVTANQGSGGGVATASTDNNSENLPVAQEVTGTQIEFMDRQAVVLKTRKYGRVGSWETSPTSSTCSLPQANNTNETCSLDGEGAADSQSPSDAVTMQTPPPTTPLPITADHCTICLLEFQQGDRVGDLRCEHVFHVDCLKQWIKRKNQCPLCQDLNLAEPQSFVPRDTQVSATNEEAQEGRTPDGDSQNPEQAAGNAAPLAVDRQDEHEQVIAFQAANACSGNTN